MARLPIQSVYTDKLNFGPHDRVTFAYRPYCRPVRTTTGWQFERDDGSELSEAFSHAEIKARIDLPGYRYERDFYAPAIVRGRAAHRAASMDDVAKSEQPEVLFRWQVCKRFERMTREGVVSTTDAGFAKAAPIIAAEVAKLECAKVRPKPRGRDRGGRGKPEAPAPEGKVRKGGRTRGVPTSGKPDVALRRMPPVSTFWKWLRKYRAAHGMPWGLRDEYGNCGGRPAPICAEAAEVLDRMGREHADPNGTNFELLLEKMRNAVAALNEGRSGDERVACPSRQQLKDFLGSLRHVRVVAARKLLGPAGREMRIASGGLGIVRPLERVEMDHWEVHLQSILVAVGLWERLNRAQRRAIGRMHLCVAIDVATRAILGMHLSETPTTADALAVVRMMVSDKGGFADAVGALTPWCMAGTPETIATDGGGAFVSDEFGLAVASLRCDQVIPPAGLPWLRGTIERFFRTAHMRLVSRFRGRTFENILALGEYPAEKLANLDTRDLAWVIVRWVVDVYHNTRHEGLGGATPREAWLEGVALYGTTPPPDPHVRRAIFGVRLARTLNGEGIRILGLRYWSHALVELFLAEGKQDVEVKLDPADVGEISVRIGRTWHAARCSRPEVAGVDAATWVEAAAELRRVRADSSELTERVIRDAIQAIERVGANALDREGIADPTPTTEQLDHFERQLLLGFQVPDPVADADWNDPGDPLAGGIPVTGPIGPENLDPVPRPVREHRLLAPPAIDPDGDAADDDFDIED